MDIATDILTGRWRRIDRAMAEVRLAVNSPNAERCADAVATALAFVNDLWETLKAPIGAERRMEFARADSAGQVTVALIFARGEVTHRLLEQTAEKTDSYSDSYYDTYEVWRWRELPISKRYKEASEWYRDHVRGIEVLRPLEMAVSWLRSRPELSAIER